MYGLTFQLWPLSKKLFDVICLSGSEIDFGSSKFPRGPLSVICLVQVMSQLLDLGSPSDMLESSW